MENMESIESLWRTYAQTRDAALKEKMILEYTPLIKIVVAKLAVHIGAHVEYEDMLSYGVFGLMDAIDKFDIDKGVKFETYASLRIRGAIIDHVRQLDWVPRALRQKNKLLDQAYTELEARLGREPTDAELAVRLGLSAKELDELIRSASVVSLVSLDDYLHQNHEMPFGGTAHGEGETPEGAYEQQEMKKMLEESIGRLTEKEQRVVTLYYFEEMTLKEISKIMGVSESRISQIHSKAMLRMRMRLGKYKAIMLV